MKRIRRDFMKSTAASAAGCVIATQESLANAQKRDMHWWSIRDAYEALRKTETTSIELTELMLARIDRIDSRQNSYLFRMDEAARKMAPEARLQPETPRRCFATRLKTSSDMRATLLGLALRLWNPINV